MKVVYTTCLINTYRMHVSEPSHPASVTPWFHLTINSITGSLFVQCEFLGTRPCSRHLIGIDLINPPSNTAR